MRILLVEDDPTTSRSIELMLTHANLNVYATDLGEEGIDLAKLYDYDLILLDLGLPDIDGIEVIRRIREWSVVPIIVLSVREREDDHHAYFVVSYKGDFKVPSPGLSDGTLRILTLTLLPYRSAQAQRGEGDFGYVAHSALTFTDLPLTLPPCRPFKALSAMSVR